MTRTPVFIHCIWTFYKENQRKGLGSLMIRACLDGARKAGSLRHRASPHGVFAVILDGRLTADHQISRTRFRNIMRNVQPAAR